MTAWLQQRERGSATGMRLMAWIARRLGWRVSQALLYPITAYFLLSAPAAQRAAMRRFLARAQGRAPTMRDLFRQYFTFACVLLDRLFLAAPQPRGYDIRITGLEALQAQMAAGRGCILLGAHLGSFAVLRAIAEAGCPVPIASLMYEDNARQAKAFFDAIAPGQGAGIIPIGQPGALLQAKECLDAGGLVGILADRRRDGEAAVAVPFFGVPALLPTGPVVLAGLLGVPVVLAFGLWRAPRQYEVRFELLAERITLQRATRQQDAAQWVAAYAARLQALATEFPRNWFNFYDFWQEAGQGAAA